MSALEPGTLLPRSGQAAVLFCDRARWILSAVGQAILHLIAPATQRGPAWRYNTEAVGIGSLFIIDDHAARSFSAVFTLMSSHPSTSSRRRQTFLSYRSSDRTTFTQLHLAGREGSAGGGLPNRKAVVRIDGRAGGILR